MNSKKITAVGIVIFFVLINLYFYSIANGLIGTNIAELFGSKSLNLDGSDFSLIATFFSNMAGLVLMGYSTLILLPISIIIALIANFIFGKFYFKNIKYDKDVYLNDLKTSKNFLLILTPIILIVLNLDKYIFLIMVGIIYYLIILFIFYAFLKSKINKVFKKIEQ